MDPPACVVIALPLKTTNELDFAKKATQTGRLMRMHTPTLDLLTAARKDVVRAMGKGVEEGSKGWAEAAQNYLALLGGGLPGGQAAAAVQHALHFYWGPSFGRKTTHAVPDFTYEAAAVVANLGVLEMKKAYALVETTQRANAERVERDAYRTLCVAAGKFAKVGELLSGISANEHFPLDATTEGAEAAKFLCLAQAQELALTKASRDTANKGRPLLAKVAAQAHLLYKTAAEAFGSLAGRAGDDPMLPKLVQFTAFKASALQIRAHLLAALSGSKENNMPAAKAAADAAAALFPIFEKRFRKGLEVNLIPQFEQVDAEQQRIISRVQSECRVVGKFQPLDGPSELPDPQVLAQPTPFELPAPSDKWAAVAGMFQAKK